MAIEMTYFADKAPNKLAENRSALSTPDTSSVVKCSQLTTSGLSTYRADRRDRSRELSLTGYTEIWHPVGSRR